MQPAKMSHDGWRFGCGSYVIDGILAAVETMNAPTLRDRWRRRHQRLKWKKLTATILDLAAHGPWSQGQTKAYTRSTCSYNEASEQGVSSRLAGKVSGGD